MATNEVELAVNSQGARLREVKAAIMMFSNGKQVYGGEDRQERAMVMGMAVMGNSNRRSFRRQRLNQTTVARTAPVQCSAHARQTRGGCWHVPTGQQHACAYGYVGRPATKEASGSSVASLCRRMSILRMLTAAASANGYSAN